VPDPSGERAATYQIPHKARNTGDLRRRRIVAREVRVKAGLPATRSTDDRLAITN
jgi:hypothetical protein